MTWGGGGEVVSNKERYAAHVDARAKGKGHLLRVGATPLECDTGGGALTRSYLVELHLWYGLRYMLHGMRAVLACAVAPHTFQQHKHHT